MKKSERITSYVASLPGSGTTAWHPCYLGYFTCFNAGEYYEAHDVLEHLWLSARDEHSAFYKGLIQLAGAFVHLRKQFMRPDHPKDGQRLKPAVRLFLLARANLENFAPRYLGLDVAGVLELIHQWVREVEAAEYRRNPWRPGKGPRLELGPAK